MVTTIIFMTPDPLTHDALALYMHSLPCVTTRQLWRAVPFIYRPTHLSLVDRSRVRVVEFEFVTQGSACQQMASLPFKLEPFRAAQLATRCLSLSPPHSAHGLIPDRAGRGCQSFVVWNTSLHVDHSLARVRVP